MSNEQCNCQHMAGAWDEKRTRIFNVTGHHYGCEKLDYSLKPYYKVALLGSPDTYFIESLAKLQSLLEEVGSGDNYVITKVMMSDVDFQYLPEFEGVSDPKPKTPISHTPTEYENYTVLPVKTNGELIYFGKKYRGMLYRDSCGELLKRACRDVVLEAAGFDLIGELWEKEGDTDG